MGDRLTLEQRRFLVMGYGEGKFVISMTSRREYGL
jgi:hypothetical protein